MSILNYTASADDGFGNIEEFKAQVEPNKVRFNPMQSWMNASKVMDEEFSRPAAQTFSANVPENIQPYSEYGGTSAQTFGLGNPEPVQPYDQMSQNPMGGLPLDSMQPPQQDPAALGFPNMPYDLTGGPSQGAAPAPVQPAALGPMYSPEAVDAQVMQDQQVMGGSGYSRPMTPEMAPFGSMDVTGGMTADQQMADGVMAPSPTPFDDAWLKAQEEGGSNPQQIQRQSAVIQTAARQNDGTNTSGGVDASRDPIMQRRLGPLASDPAKRKEAYLKRMNTAFMQSIFLDIAANAMGVKSRSGQFMEMMQKSIDAEMKFDDEERLAEINRSVFFPNGVYEAPANAREAFDRAIMAGATPEEAASISGHIPEGEEVGFDTYYKEREDGSVETLYVPKGQAPPQGATPASGVATHNADLMAPAGAGKDPTDIAVPKEIMRLEADAKKLREQGRVEEAEQAEMLAGLIRQRSYGSRTNVLADKRVLFDSLWGSYYKPPSDRPGKVPQPFFALPPRTADGEVIPESEREPLSKDDLFFLFGNSPDTIDVYDRQGKLIRINPYSLFSSPNAGINPYPKDVSINILRANPNMETLKQFVDVYGAEALPREFA